MKTFLAFVKKEFYHILRDPRTILIVLGIPIVQIILFGFAITTEVKNANIAVLSPLYDQNINEIITKVNESEYFSISEHLSGPEEIEPCLKKGNTNIVMVFEENFTRHLESGKPANIQLLIDATDPNYATSLENYISGIILSHYPIRPNFIITPQVNLLYNPMMLSSYNFVPGVMGLILMLICAMMTAISIVREKEKGNMEVLLVSPLPSIFIILAKAIPYFVLSTFNLLTIILLSYYVLGVPIAGSLFWLFVLSLIFIFGSLSLGLLISTLAEKQVVAMLISGMVLMMPTIVLSGMMFPIESMPPFLQGVSSIIPARWYISGVKKIMIQGVEVQYIAKELLILTVMGIVLISASIKNFKVRL